MAPSSVTSLALAVRGRVVLKYFGQLSLSLVAMTGVPCAVALIAGDYELAWRFGVILLVILPLGLTLGRMAAPAAMQVNEALVVAAMIFLVAALSMSWPLSAHMPYLDALFESVSAITTTGLSTLPSVEDQSLGFLFTRAWMQWYGGLIILVLAIALLTGAGPATRRLGAVEGQADDLVGGTRAWARRVLLVYLVLTAFGFAVVWLLGVDAWDALLHVLAAVSTGGFSSHSESLTGLGGAPVQGVLTLLCLLGAVSFALYYRVWRVGWRALGREAELGGLMIAGLVTTLLVAGSMALVGGRSWVELLHHAPLIAFSAQTTAGFSTLSIADLDPASKAALIASMGIGGNVGSTAGGIKIIRLIIVLKLIRLLFQRTSVPRHAVVQPRLAGQLLEEDEIQAALTLVLLFVAVIALSWLSFLLLGHDPLDALFEVVSATGTVGLSSGVTSPGLEPVLKGVLCLDMLMGRLEIVAFLVLFFPPTWVGRRGGLK